MIRALSFAICLALSGLLLVQASWIHAKAWLAQQLIASAWDRTLSHQGQPQKPWHWADTYPVARLALPGQDDLYVLNGGQGNALAFGPGLVEGSDPLGAGFSAVGGHRDTHFRSLAGLQTGQRFKVQGIDGEWYWYEITGAGPVNIHQQPLAQTGREQLVLVTCYPFDTVQADPDQRWVVTGDRIRL